MIRRVKTLGKKFVRRVALKLANAVGETLVTAPQDDRLVSAPQDERGRYVTFVDLASRFNVRTLTVAGDYGLIQSAADDIESLGAYARTGRWASRTNEVLQQFFAKHPVGSYIDVGANIGLTTIPVAQRRTVSCLAIEADPTNYQNLVANIAANCPHGNVITKHQAVFSRGCSLKFEISPENRGDHRIRLSNGPGVLHEELRHVIDVDASPLDEIVPPLEGAVAVKVDTQGAEPFVVEGGTRTLGKADLMIMEIWPYGLARMGGNPDVIIQLVRDRFHTAMIGMGEEEPFTDSAAVSKVAAELERLVSTKQNDVFCYLDVVAWR
jgi:FkbM family methyltransferase